jgi:glutamyl/glutaminyl-tRNA synthetase
MIDLYLSVENNLIVKGKAYSDCLFPDFIEAINENINSKTIHYDRNGVKALEAFLTEMFKNKPEYIKFSQELCSWMDGAL